MKHLLGGGVEAVELYGEFIKPNVSYCEQENDVHYNPYSFADEYLTMIARENGTITFIYPSGIPTTKATSISYSINDAEWITTSNVNETEVTVTVPVVSGDKVRWKGDNVVMGDSGAWAFSYFASDCEVDINGNIMSLLYSDDFKDKTAFDAETQMYVFYRLFSNNNGSLNVANAKNLSLPATTLAIGCYSQMFYGCTSLTTAPELTATTLAEDCYSNMFYGCTSLTTAPELPATTLVANCYWHMFYNCTSLTTAPELPATTLATQCYSAMFYNCASLTKAPELPATTLANYCYSTMFYGCTSLTKAPELPATTLANYCYDNMFQGCTNLTTVPSVLPATTLADSCYSSMFKNCTSLTTAPQLPATTLADGCYASMFSGCTRLITAPELPATTLARVCYNYLFNGCTSLNYIKAMFTTTPGTNLTRNWVEGVASTGTFVKNSAATWTTSGNNGVPSGWTVETASA